MSHDLSLPQYKEGPKEINFSEVQLMLTLRPVLTLQLTETARNVCKDSSYTGL